MADLAPYRVLLGSRIRSQFSYRRGFVLDFVGSLAIGLLEFVEVYVLFHNTPILGGLDFGAVALVFAIANVGFCLADMSLGHLDELTELIRSGDLDALLLRPLPVLAQLITSDIQLKRVGRLSVALVVGVVALGYTDIDWDLQRLALLVVAPLAAAGIFGALFTVAAGVQFWLVEGAEFTNSFVYGGSYASSYPASVYPLPLRVLFSFVIPAAFVGYLPALVLLDLPGPAGLPQWLGWCTPLAAIIAWIAALAVWRRGLRHYTGTGS